MSVVAHGEAELSCVLYDYCPVRGLCVGLSDEMVRKLHLVLCGQCSCMFFDGLCVGSDLYIITT